MISTVGDIRKALEGLPDETYFELEIKKGCLYGDDIEEIRTRSERKLPPRVIFVIGVYEARDE